MIVRVLGCPPAAAAGLSCTISFTDINFSSFDVGNVYATGTGTFNCTGGAANNEYVMCIHQLTQTTPPGGNHTGSVVVEVGVLMTGTLPTVRELMVTTCETC